MTVPDSKNENNPGLGVNVLTERHAVLRSARWRAASLKSRDAHCSGGSIRSPGSARGQKRQASGPVPYAWVTVAGSACHSRPPCSGEMNATGCCRRPPGGWWRMATLQSDTPARSPARRQAARRAAAPVQRGQSGRVRGQALQAAADGQGGESEEGRLGGAGRHLGVSAGGGQVLAGGAEEHRVDDHPQGLLEPVGRQAFAVGAAEATTETSWRRRPTASRRPPSEHRRPARRRRVRRRVTKATTRTCSSGSARPKPAVSGVRRGWRAGMEAGGDPLAAVEGMGVPGIGEGVDDGQTSSGSRLA